MLSLLITIALAQSASASHHKPLHLQPDIDFSQVCRLAYKAHISASEAQAILNEYLDTINEPHNTLTVPELCEVVLAPSSIKIIQQGQSS